MKYPKRKSREEKIREVIQTDNEVFEKEFIDDYIGYGVFSTVDIDPNEPLLEYRGEHLSKCEIEKTVKEYEARNVRTCFIYELSFLDQDMCIDATFVDCMARYVNDSPDHFANCKMKKEIIDNEIHLIIYSMKKIHAGDELRYNYGDSDNDWRVEEVYVKPTNISLLSKSKEKKEKSKHVLFGGFICAPEDDFDKENENSEVNEFSKVTNENNGKGTLTCEEENVNELDRLEVELADGVVKEKIGEGSFARVFKISNSAFKEFMNPLSIRRTKKIAKKLAMLNHRNIVKFQGFCKKPSGFFFELCEISFEEEAINTVSQLIEIWNEDNIYDFKKRKNIVIQIGCGLEYLHSNHIIHKDIKPANILVSGCLKNIVVKLTDFDDVFELKTAATVTKTSQAGCKFTLIYGAPELCLQQSEHSFQTDIYSWGLTVFEIFSGISHPWKKVFQIYSDTLLIDALRSKKRPPLDILHIRYPDVDLTVLLDVIGSSWETDPLKRMLISQSLQYLRKESTEPIEQKKAGPSNGLMMRNDSCDGKDLKIDDESNTSKHSKQPKNKRKFVAAGNVSVDSNETMQQAGPSNGLMMRNDSCDGEDLKIDDESNTSKHSKQPETKKKFVAADNGEAVINEPMQQLDVQNDSGLQIDEDMEVLNTSNESDESLHALQSHVNGVYDDALHSSDQDSLKPIQIFCYKKPKRRCPFCGKRF